MTTVVTVIEPDLSQFIGARLLQLSLQRNCSTPLDFRLILVRRAALEQPLLRCAATLHWGAQALPTPYSNPYLNKWLWSEAPEELRSADNIVMLDWDMLMVGRAALPGPFANRIGARPNPPDLYRDRLASLPPNALPAQMIDHRHQVRSSINGGLLISTARCLRRCAKRTLQYERILSRCAAQWAFWEREQLALSLAVGEIGLIPLESGWNATRRTDVPHRDIRLWHYSDGWSVTRGLKRSLHRPEIALGYLRELRAVYPEGTALFLELYSSILDQAWFHRLVQLELSCHGDRTSF